MSTSSGWLMAKAMTRANELDRVQIVTHPPRFVDDWHVCYVSNAVECARRVRGQRSEQCVEVVGSGPAIATNSNVLIIARAEVRL